MGSWWAAAAGVIALALPCLAHAQRPDSATVRDLYLDIGSPTESYLRALQSLGTVGAAQVAVRPWGPRELDRLLAGDTVGASLKARTHLPRRVGPVVVQLAPAALNLWYNSTFPFGYNDGAVWRGRGVTAALEGGVVMRAGPLSASLRPAVFWAQNQAFALMSTAMNDSLPFADPLTPTYIDRPQRFGDRPYARLGLGESTLRLDAGAFALGASTASQWWGPMHEWPYLLSNNAGGFPHLFVGTAAPANVGIGRLHARLLYGRLSQSDYTNIGPDSARRLGSGLIVSFSPRGLETLEISLARFFHEPWPRGGLTLGALAKPVEDLFKRDLVPPPGSADTVSFDNQLASLSIRWVFPRNGLEVYGEVGREDHSYDERDLILSPDHQATFGLGIRKSWRTSPGSINAIRAEFIDLDPSNLARTRQQGSKYLHYVTRQGHTESGQLLGSGFSADHGAAAMITAERLGEGGRRDLLSLSRMVVRDSRVAGRPGLDVQYALGAEWTGPVRGHRVSYGLTGVYELDRYFTSDAGNLMATVALVW